MNPSVIDPTQLTSPWNLALIAGVWTLIQLVRKLAVVPKRVAIVLPYVLCQAAMWMPGPWLSPDLTWGQRLVLGLAFAVAVEKAHRGIAKSGAEKTLRLEPRKKKDPA